MRIVLVHNSQVIRESQRNALVALGHSDIVETGCGEAALTSIIESAPDLILVNANLPRMDTVTFIKKVRAQGVETPIIMCANRPTKFGVMEAIRAGASDYVVAPFTCEVLGKKLEHVMSSAEATVEHAMPKTRQR